jgi:hypothetical protein
MATIKHKAMVRSDESVCANDVGIETSIVIVVCRAPPPMTGGGKDQAW